MLVWRLPGDYIQIMALIDCQKCGATIGSKLSACPYCEPIEVASAPVTVEIADAANPKPSWQSRFTPSLAVVALACSCAALLAFAFLVFRNPTTSPPQQIVHLRGPYFTQVAPADETPGVTVPENKDAVGKIESRDAVMAENPMNRLRAAAEGGDSRAQFEMGLSNYPDANRVKDYRESLRWFKKAAERGHVDSQKQMGWMHYEGQGVVRDSETALKWYQMAADQGDAEAQRAVELLTADREELARLAAIQIELAKLDSFEPKTGVVAKRDSVALEMAAQGRSLEMAANNVIRESHTDRESPSIVFNESNQFITINQQPDARERFSNYDANNRRYDPRDRYGDYLAASGFFARTRQDAASRAFFERNRQRDRSRISTTRQKSGRTESKQSPFSSQRVSFPRTLGGAPLTGSPRPLSKAVTPLGSYPKAPWDD